MTQPQAIAHSGNGAIRAVIGKVRDSGEQRFAIAYLEKGATLPGIGEGESITFSLSDWQGEQEPRKEQVVLLEGVQLFAKGWRAISARPIILEPQATRKEQP